MSRTYIAAIVALISGLLPLAGFEVADSEVLTNTIFNLVSIIAGAVAIYGRVKVGDINWLGIRRKYTN
jgi:hypothetical protein